MITREQQIKLISKNVNRALAELAKDGIKANDLADVAGLARSTVKRLLEGETMPGGLTIGKLAKALWCEPGDLLPSLSDLKVRKQDSLYSKRLNQATLKLCDTCHGSDKLNGDGSVCTVCNSTRFVSRRLRAG